MHKIALEEHFADDFASGTREGLPVPNRQGEQAFAVRARATA